MNINYDADLDIMNKVMDQHNSCINVLSRRNRLLKGLYENWNKRGADFCISQLAGNRDMSVTVDCMSALIV